MRCGVRQTDTETQEAGTQAAVGAAPVGTRMQAHRRHRRTPSVLRWGSTRTVWSGSTFGHGTHSRQREAHRCGVRGRQGVTRCSSSRRGALWRAKVPRRSALTASQGHFLSVTLPRRTPARAPWLCPIAGGAQGRSPPHKQRTPASSPRVTHHTHGWQRAPPRKRELEGGRAEFVHVRSLSAKPLTPFLFAFAAGTVKSKSRSALTHKRWGVTPGGKKRISSGGPRLCVWWPRDDGCVHIHACVRAHGCRCTPHPSCARRPDASATGGKASRARKASPRGQRAEPPAPSPVSCTGKKGRAAQRGMARP